MKITLIASCLLLSSCVIPITKQVTVGRPLKIRVVDAESKRPVANASVWFDGWRETTAHTDANGTAVLNKRQITKTFWMPPAPVDPPPWFHDYTKAPLQIAAPQYRSFVIPATSRVKEVQLIPK